MSACDRPLLEESHGSLPALLRKFFSSPQIYDVKRSENIAGVEPTSYVEMSFHRTRKAWSQGSKDLEFEALLKID